MREHQIVITLKPDQFLEVQRLARAANAKSMGIFVRQKLLAALGIEGAGNAVAGEQLNAENVEAALGQVRRLHGELKTFVAESLSLYNYDSDADTAPTAGSRPPLPNSVASGGSPASDAMENVAERTFAISPRLGALGEGPVKPQMVAAGESPLNVPADATAAENHSKHEAHRRDREQHRYHPHSQSEVMDEPFKGGDPASKGQNAPVISDPLEKLLPKQDARPAAQSQATPGTVVPPQPQPQPLPQPTIRPVIRESALPPAAPGQQPPPPASFYFLDEPAVPQSLSDALEAAVAAGPEQVESAEPQPLPDSAAPATQPEPPVQTQDDNSKPSVPRSMDYPSLSGSPPPKRRRV